MGALPTYQINSIYGEARRPRIFREGAGRIATSTCTFRDVRTGCRARTRRQGQGDADQGPACSTVCAWPSRHSVRSKASFSARVCSDTAAYPAPSAARSADAAARCRYRGAARRPRPVLPASPARPPRSGWPAPPPAGHRSGRRPRRPGRTRGPVRAAGRAARGTGRRPRPGAADAGWSPNSAGTSRAPRPGRPARRGAPRPRRRREQQGGLPAGGGREVHQRLCPGVLGRGELRGVAADQVAPAGRIGQPHGRARPA